MSQRNLLQWVTALGVGIVGILALVLLFPIWQTIAYGLLIENPATIQWTVVTGLVGIILYKTDRVGPDVTAAVVGIGLLSALLIAPMISGWYAQEHIIENQDFEQRAELPETSSDHVRVLPRAVADQYAESSMQKPVYSLGPSDPVYRNGSYQWSYPVEPDRTYVKLTGDQNGSYYVNMEQNERSVTTVERPIDNGFGVLFIDNYNYQMALQRADVDRRENTAFTFVHDDEQYIAQSYETHNWEFRLLPIPQLYAVPEYGGTIVIDEDGSMQDLSPREVDDSQLLESQNTYPYGLTTFRVGSMRYNDGLLNAVFVGDGVPEIADPAGQGNEQPYVVPKETNGSPPQLLYYVETQPAGSGNGVYQIYTVDAQTGAVEYVQYDGEQASSQQAAGYVRSQDREPNWVANNDDGSTAVTEPIPLIIDGQLYWHMRVVPTDSSKIAYTTFVNAETSNVYRATTTVEIYEFVNDGNAQSNTTVDESNMTNATDSGMITVTVIDDGEAVRQFTVNENQSVVINATNGE